MDLYAEGWTRGVPRKLMWGAAAALLAAPLIAMRMTHEVDWSAGDFAAAGVLLFGAAALVEVAMRARVTALFRAGAVTATLTALASLWVQAAVGLIGSEADPYNRWFALVLGVAAVGSLVSRFAPKGMATTMTLAAALQVAVAAGGAAQDPWGAVFAGAFALPWLLAAAFFAAAAKDHAPPLR